MASVAKELFHNKYWINVEERAFYSDEWLDNVGIMGVTSIDEAEAVLSRFRQIRVSIPDLAIYYSKGYRLEFINTPDISEMFNLINTHLDNWTQLTNRLGYVHPMPPIEDFELLDNLAELLFPYRKVDNALLGVMSIFQGPLRAANSLNFAQGVYIPYSPKLYKYCEQAGN